MENRQFIEKAVRLARPLRHWTVRPKNCVKAVRSADAWQGWTMKTVAAAAEFLKTPQGVNDSFTLDFGEEFVGCLTMKITTDVHADSPIRLRLIFAETPVEIGERDQKSDFGLSPAWYQEEIVNLDDPPLAVTLPRVYAMRYLYVELLAATAKIFFTDVLFKAGSAVKGFVPPLPEFDARDRALDRAAQRTLRNCMQEAVLDGPKRDRRLWLGDLRLEAQVNAVTYRKFDLFERCAYMLAAFSDERGMINACCYHKPVPQMGGCFISDYAFLFADLILFHYRMTDRKAFLADLYPVAARQFEIFRPYFREGLPDQDPPGWNFIDWDEGLDRNTATACSYVFGLLRLAECADVLGKAPEAAEFRQEARFLQREIRQNRFDEHAGLFFSGKAHQFSEASQIWAVLAEAVSAEEGRRLLKTAESVPAIRRAVTPYLKHHLLEAYDAVGAHDDALRIMRDWWGKMLDKGMNVYPEVFVPENERLTPYGNTPRILSACHAWSCAPAWSLRKHRLQK